LTHKTAFFFISFKNGKQTFQKLEFQKLSLFEWCCCFFVFTCFGQKKKSEKKPVKLISPSSTAAAAH
jgi:hypothetical protein